MKNKHPEQQPNNEDKALRYNKGKLDWTLIDYEALIPLVEVMTYGADKYTVDEMSGRNNWKKEVDPKQHLQSAMRHLISIIQGEEIDKESGKRHSGHLMANMMMYNYHTKPVKLSVAINYSETIDHADKYRNGSLINSIPTTADIPYANL